SPVSISTLQEGRFVNVNDAWLKTMGFAKEEVIGRTSTEINFVIPSVSRRELIDRIRKESGVPNWEFDLRLRNGERRTFLGAVEIITLDGNEYFLVASQDITQRKLMEEKLRASEERYRSLFERNLAGVYKISINGLMLEGNQSLAQMFGFDSFEQMRSMSSWSPYLNDDDRLKMLEKLRSQSRLNNYEMLQQRRDGTLIWTLSNITLVPGEDDEAEMLEGVVL